MPNQQSLHTEGSRLQIQTHQLLAVFAGGGLLIGIATFVSGTILGAAQVKLHGLVLYNAVFGGFLSALTAWVISLASGGYHEQ